ncbi:MAG: hypothetical protein JKX71_13965 [Amylibacter sp.]|nr:hypothetical protein [Amylibacter sp.]
MNAIYIATTDGCNARHYDDQVIEEVIAQAADAFYPGILNILKRREYRKDMTTRISHPKFMGSIKAMNGNCILAGRLADASRAPVDRSIEAANAID